MVYMYLTLTAPGPFIAALLLIIFLSEGFKKISSPLTVNKVLAVPWGLYIFILQYANNDFVAAFINSLFQVFFVYWYLQIAYFIEEKIIFYLFFLVIGAYALAFLNGFIYTLIINF